MGVKGAGLYSRQRQQHTPNRYDSNEQTDKIKGYMPRGRDESVEIPELIARDGHVVSHREISPDLCRTRRILVSKNSTSLT